MVGSREGKNMLERSFKKAREMRLSKERQLLHDWDQQVGLADQGDPQALDKLDWIAFQLEDEDSPTISPWWTRNEVGEGELCQVGETWFFSEDQISEDGNSFTCFDQQMDDTWWESEINRQPVPIADEPNWDHLKGISQARDRHLNVALRKVRYAKSQGELLKVGAIAKRYARDSMLTKEGKLKDGNRKVGIGFDYQRYATLVNSIAEKAEALGLGEWKRLPIQEFQKPQEPEKDGDLLDEGCRTGEFEAEGPVEITCPYCDNGWDSRGICLVCEGWGFGQEHKLMEKASILIAENERLRSLSNPRIQSFRMEMEEIEEWLNPAGEK
jgi:hypothetical protein